MCAVSKHSVTGFQFPEILVKSQDERIQRYSSVRVLKAKLNYSHVNGTCIFLLLQREPSETLVLWLSSSGDASITSTESCCKGILVPYMFCRLHVSKHLIRSVESFSNLPFYLFYRSFMGKKPQSILTSQSGH